MDTTNKYTELPKTDKDIFYKIIDDISDEEAKETIKQLILEDRRKVRLEIEFI